MGGIKVLDGVKKWISEALKTHRGESKVKEGGDKPTNSNLLSNLLIVFLIGVLMVIVGSMFAKEDSSKGSGNGTTAVSAIGETTTNENLNDKSSAENKEYKEKMQKELVSLLEQIDGVGKVTSMMYFSSGQEQVPVFNQQISKSITNEKDNGGGQREITQENGGSTVVMENNENKQQPFITKTFNPTITGICVVAEGASDNVTELRIRQAVTKLFGLEDNKVQVYPMKK